MPYSHYPSMSFKSKHDRNVEIITSFELFFIKRCKRGEDAALHRARHISCQLCTAPVTSLSGALFSQRKDPSLRRKNHPLIRKDLLPRGSQVRL